MTFLQCDDFLRHPAARSRYNDLSASRGAGPNLQLRRRCGLVCRRDEPLRRLRLPAVDAAASALADFIRRKLLDSPPLLPRNRIMIVTGAPASGKTVAASTLRLPTTEIVHETILTSPEKASRIVREALHAKRVPRINLFYTEDPRLNVRRMILRARRIGRTVPVAYMAKAYSGVPRIVRDLSREYKKSLELLIANNSGAEDQVVFHQRIEEAVHSTGRYTEVDCLEIMDHELGEIHQAEKIPDSILQEARLR